MREGYNFLIYIQFFVIRERGEKDIGIEIKGKREIEIER